MGCSTSIARQDVHEDAHIAHSLGVMSIDDSDPDLSDCKEKNLNLDSGSDQTTPTAIAGAASTANPELGCHNDAHNCEPQASAELGHQDAVHTGERQAHDRHIRAFNVYLKAVYHAPETFVELVDARRKASFGT
ncbi:unnamed protein product [Effrenium voratum]|nr:unnamed protein product [Effrenium voratum]